MNFRDFGLAEPIVRAVLQEGYSVATPIQEQAIPTVLDGHDVIGIAQTGTGKTAAFALPILHRLTSTETKKSSSVRKIRVLVLASTRELAVQIHDSFRNYGAFAAVRVATIYGGVGQHPQVKALRDGVDVVVATPGRLLDLMKQGYVHLEGVQTLVLDEADRMLDMGFFPAIRRILEHVPRKRQTLMFSATMKPEIRELANSILTNPVSISIIPKHKTTDLVEQSVCFVPQKQKTRLLIELIAQRRPTRTIVFSRTKHGADRIVRHLAAAGLRAEAIHANKSQNKRQRTLDDFKSERPPILVATDIAARGIDVDNVSHIFNHDMPTEEETYVHRIGRSGRAGATGEAISLCDPDERRMLKSIEKLIGMQIAVEEVAGFDFKPTAEESAAPERRERSGGNRNDRGRSGSSPRPRAQQSGRAGTYRTEGGSAQAEAARTSRGGRSNDGQRQDNGGRRRSGSDRSAVQNTGTRRSSAGRGESQQQSPEVANGALATRRTASDRPAQKRPVSRRESDGSFGDGVYHNDPADSPSVKSGDQSPAPRRRRRPASASS